MSCQENDETTMNYLWKHKRELFRDKGLWLFVVLSCVVSVFQLYVAVITESLGSFADCVHRIEHTLSLLIVAVGNVLEKRKYDMRYSYGYGRHEILMVFSLNLSVVIICCFFLFELLHGLSDGHHSGNIALSPEIIRYADGLTYISFFVSLLSIFGFRRYKQQYRDRYTMDVYRAKGTGHMGLETSDLVHITIDISTIIFTIVSNYLSVKKRLVVADTIECLVMSLFMLYHSWPQVKCSAEILVLGIPDEIAQEIRTLFRRISMVDGVVEVKSSKYWIEGPGHLVGQLSIEAHRTVDTQKLLQIIHTMCSNTFQEMVVQIDQNPSLEWME